MRLSKSSILGFGAGVLFTLLAVNLQKSSGGESSEILAEIGGERLTRQALRQELAQDLIPTENDEYQILSRGVEQWVDERLLEKEAKAEGVTLEELFRKKVWSHVQVSYDDILAFYNQNRELYKQPFEQVNRLVSDELRRSEYARSKREYLAGLRKKYDVKIDLVKPKSYVEGLALPTVTPGRANAVPAVKIPVLPNAPTPPLPSESKMGVPPWRGAQNAPITLTEYADFHCHFCKVVKPTLDQLMKNYPGKIRWIFHHYPLSTTPGAGSFLTHEASVCAQEQGKFWEFYDKVFALAQAPQESDLQNIAQEINLDKTKFQECLKSGRNQNFLLQEKNEGSQKGIQGTPTLYVNDQLVAGAYPYDHFVGVVEGILNPGKAPAMPKPAPPQPPAPAAGPVKFDDLKGRPSLGPKEAPITLVEFSDFHCPFCKKVTPTLEQLMKNYQGKIRRVWRQYPLSFHQGASHTSEASECAHEQDKFWEYHDKLFETQGGPRDDAALVKLAQDVKLDKKKFEKCLASGKYKDLVQKEITRGNQVGVQGTPAVFVNGTLVSGAQPYENFDRVVQSQLNKK